MADTFTVASRWVFGGDLGFLERLATLSDGVATNIEAATKATSGFNRAMAAIARNAERADGPLSAMRDTVASVGAAADGSTAALERMGRAANRGSVAGGARTAAGSFLGGAGTIGGLASLALVGAGIRNASAMQNAELQAAIATGKMGGSYDQTMRNMEPLKQQAYRMSAMTGGSAVDMMQVIQNIAASGFTAGQIKSMQTPLAQLTDVLHFGKTPMSFGDAATQAAGLAHDLRLMNAKDAEAGFNRLAQLQYQAPHGINQLITQTRRFAPQFEDMLPGNNKAQKASQILEYTAWLDRMGILQFGGTGLNQLATYLQKPKTKNQLAAFNDLGLYAGGQNLFRDTRTGQYNLPGALEQIARRYATAENAPGGRARVLDDVHSISTNAARTLQALMTPDALAALDRIRTQTKSMPNLGTIQTQLMETPGHAFARLITNIETLSTIIGDKLVPPLGVIAGKLAGNIGGLNDFLGAHPQAATAAAAVAGVGAVYGAYKLFHMIGGLAAFGHIAAHSARESAGLGAGAYLRTGGHAAGGILGGIGRIGNMFGNGVDLFPTIGRLGTEVRGLGTLFRSFGMDVLFTRGGLALLAENVGRLGLRAVPVAGNIMLIIDAVTQFVKHGTDISFAMGRATRWIDDVGKPALVSAITGAWSSAMAALGKMLPAMGGWIRDSVWNSLTGNVGAGTGLQGTVASIGAWIHQQQASNDAAYRAGYGLPATEKQKAPIVVQNVNLPNVKDPKSFAAALHTDPRFQNAKVQGTPVSPLLPPVLSTGLGFGGR